VLDFAELSFPPACAACDAPGAALCAASAPSPRDALAFVVEGVPAFALGAYDGTLRRTVVAMKHGERDPLDTFAACSPRAPFEGVLVLLRRRAHAPPNAASTRAPRLNRRPRVTLRGALAAGWWLDFEVVYDLETTEEHSSHTALTDASKRDGIRRDEKGSTARKPP